MAQFYESVVIVMLVVDALRGAAAAAHVKAVKSVRSLWAQGMLKVGEIIKPEP